MKRNMVEKDKVSGHRPFIKYEPRGPSDTEPFRLHIPVGDGDTDWKASRMNLPTLQVLITEADVEKMKSRLDGREFSKAIPGGIGYEDEPIAHDFDAAYEQPDGEEN